MDTHTDSTFKTGLRSLVGLAIILLTALAASGCQTHAPYRYGDDYYYDDGYYYDYSYDDYYYEPRSHVAFEYYFYPDHHVYYDIHRHLYFYNHIHHGWIGVSVLPKHIVLNHHHRQKFKLHHSQPWKKHRIKNVRRHHNVAQPHGHNTNQLKRYPQRKDKAALHNEPHNTRGKALKRTDTDRNRQPAIKQDARRDMRRQQQTISSTKQNKRKSIQSNVRRDERLEKHNAVTTATVQDTHRDKRSQRQAISDTDQNRRKAIQSNARQNRQIEKRAAIATVQDTRREQKIERSRRPDTAKEVVQEARRKERNALNNERNSWQNRQLLRDENNQGTGRFQRDGRSSFRLRRN